ncbi:hypothetical protein CLOM_g9389 [Closterium sp. NIES-68]|nr:hypothetical protein CLOM_g9389 [Closterium sp. NIES-68]GJP64103.1 hypothetical protein CLOP_g21128 [Closterium sp. NIES-67]
MAPVFNVTPLLPFGILMIGALGLLAPASAATYSANYNDALSYYGGQCFSGIFLSDTPYNGLVAKIPSNKFQRGLGCGTCYEIRCTNHESCRNGGVNVTAIDDAGNGFLLSSEAWDKIVKERSTQKVDVTARRVNCARSGGMAVLVMSGSDPSWFWIQILNVANCGGVAGVEVARDGATSWTKMSRMYDTGQWELKPATAVVAPGKKISVRVTGLGGRKVELKNVIGADWLGGGQTYTSNANF